VRGVTALLREAVALVLGEGTLEPAVEEEIEELRTQPEFKDVQAFAQHKLDNEDLEFGFVELQALARNATQARTGNRSTTLASDRDVRAIKDELVSAIGFRYVPRGVVRNVRGHTSPSHGSHPLKGMAGGSGFGSDFTGTTFTSFGGGPGAIGGEYDWDPESERNLPMGAKRKR